MDQHVDMLVQRERESYGVCSQCARFQAEMVRKVWTGRGSKLKLHTVTGQEEPLVTWRCSLRAVETSAWRPLTIIAGVEAARACRQALCIVGRRDGEMEPLGAQAMVKELWFQALKSRLLKFGFAFHFSWNKKVFDLFLFYRSSQLRDFGRLGRFWSFRKTLDTLGRFLIM